MFLKIGRVASEEVTLQLIKSKCLPVLLYALEACPLTIAVTRFVIIIRAGFTPSGAPVQEKMWRPYCMNTLSPTAFIRHAQ